MYDLNPATPLEVFVSLPRHIVARGGGSVEIDVYWTGGNVVFSPKDAPSGWADQNLLRSTSTNNQGETVNISTFAIKDWADRIDPKTGLLEGELKVTGNNGYARATVRAHIIESQTDSYGGDWKQWQS